ncbi:MAG: hypothetical protein ACK5HR_04335, partial [Mycoplasmatales bacterium]
FNSYKEFIEVVIQKSDDNPEERYQKFTKRVEAYDGDLTNKSAKLKEVIEQYNEAEEKKQELYQKSLKATLKVAAKAMDKLIEKTKEL